MLTGFGPSTRLDVMIGHCNQTYVFVHSKLLLDILCKEAPSSRDTNTGRRSPLSWLETRKLRSNIGLPSISGLRALQSERQLDAINIIWLHTEFCKGSSLIFSLHLWRPLEFVSFPNAIMQPASSVASPGWRVKEVSVNYMRVSFPFFASKSTKISRFPQLYSHHK